MCDMSPGLTSIAATVVLAAAWPGFAGGAWTTLGAPFTLTVATPIERIAADPAAFHDRVVRIEGRIASVCTQEGCFIEVVPEQGGEGIVVNFPGLVHTFPTDCAGLEATVEGRLYQKVYPRARVDHWQHHSFRPGVAIPDFSLVLRMDAHAARIGGERSSIPPPASLRAVAPDRIDLDRVGFEDEGFGLDRRRIAPGGSVPRPSSGGNRWLVLCREGEVVVNREDGIHVALGPGELSFLPAGTDFDVRNVSSGHAVVELLYSKEVTPADRH
jgi:mannose-6-phosphate isomerase-like protein (cupin superfamily)